MEVSSIVEEIILDLKPETDPQTVIASNFDTSLSLIDVIQSKINRKKPVVNNIINQIPNKYLPIYQRYILYSSAHETFLQISYILGHKASLRKFRRIEIVSFLFYDHQ